MSILLPTPRSSQPDYPVLVDSRNQIANGLIVSAVMTPAGVVYDSSRRGRNGSAITSTNVTRRSGLSGTNLDFDGSQTNGSVSFGGSYDFNGLFGFTVEVDFVIRSLSSTSALAGKKNGVPAWAIYVNTSGRLQLNLGLSGGVSAAWQSQDNSIAVNRQTHVVVSFLSGNVRMYINGNPATLARDDGPTSLAINDDNAATLQIGRTNEGNALTGSVSMVNLWSRGLSSAEAYSRYMNKWSLFATPSNRFLSNFSGAAPVTTTNTFQSFSRGVGRGIARGIA